MSVYYLAVDVEGRGPDPYRQGMVSLGACNVDREEESFYIEFERYGDLPSSFEAFTVHGLTDEYLKEAGVPVDVGMKRFADWVDSTFPQLPVFVAKPLGYDYRFVSAAFDVAQVRNPWDFGSYCLDLRSYVSGMTGRPLNRCHKSYMRRLIQMNLGQEAVRKIQQHSHRADEDARELAGLFRCLRRVAQEANFQVLPT